MKNNIYHFASISDFVLLYEKIEDGNKKLYGTANIKPSGIIAPMRKIIALVYPTWRRNPNIHENEEYQRDACKEGIIDYFYI